MPATDSAGNDNLTCWEKVALVARLMCFVCFSAAVQQPKDQRAQANSSSKDCTWMGWIWQWDQTVTGTNPGTGRNINTETDCLSLTAYKRLTNTILYVYRYLQPFSWSTLCLSYNCAHFFSTFFPPVPCRQPAGWTLVSASTTLKRKKAALFCTQVNCEVWRQMVPSKHSCGVLHPHPGKIFSELPYLLLRSIRLKKNQPVM